MEKKVVMEEPFRQKRDEREPQTERTNLERETIKG